MDAVGERFWAELDRIFRAHGIAPLRREDRRVLMRQVDRVIDRFYGLTQQTALTAELFATIVRATDIAAETPFRRAVERVRSLVERRDPDWWNRIRGKATPESRDPFLRVVSVLDGPAVDRQRLLRSRLMDPQRRWVDGSPRRLSDRVWSHGKSVRSAIDQRLIEGISRGEDALSIARDLEQYLRPSKAPIRYLADGRIVRQNMTATPGRGGYGGTFSRTLARTEVSRVHAAATLEAARITPGNIGMRYRLSGSHPRQDVCSALASADPDDLGPGVYKLQNFPLLPQHPNCLCAAVPVQMSRDDMIADLVARYGD